MASPAPLDVVVRFAVADVPDLVLRIERPAHTSSASLKQLIRTHLPPISQEQHQNARLRLIHAGKVLTDATALAASLNVAPPPAQPDANAKSSKAKGKLPVRDSPLRPVPRVYVHCSIGDALSASELAAESAAARDADFTLSTSAGDDDAKRAAARGAAPLPGADPSLADDASTTTPAPRGFDRLLAAGFTASEVAALRTQFLAIQSHTHTPDTMPMGAELLTLEERWLDNTSRPAEAGGPGDTGGFGAEDAGGLEDMLYGNLIGFFWPVGAICWLMREEGVWTRRRQIAVLSGFLVNLTFGFLKVMN